MSRFEWDKEKASKNKQDHDGISFEEASEIFDDPFILSTVDDRFDYGEERWIGIGLTKSGKLLVVAYKLLDQHSPERIRIISAREANKKEQKAYETDS